MVDLNRKKEGRVASSAFEPYVGQGWRDGPGIESGPLLQS